MLLAGLSLSLAVRLLVLLIVCGGSKLCKGDIDLVRPNLELSKSQSKTKNLGPLVKLVENVWVD